MREIDDAQQAKNDRQPKGDKDIQEAQRKAVASLHDQHIQHRVVVSPDWSVIALSQSRSRFILTINFIDFAGIRRFEPNQH
ncbi:hypothetical protein [Acidocella sp.]|uniref:hypothetical protein n=1 Tax=Acidocella sp. TaxID=50710 RepID=UPI002621A8D2|nr:hypothetical protein [Acidocella sp.]